MAKYSYSAGSGGLLVRTKEKGIASGGAVTSGVRTKTTMTGAGYVREVVQEDIATGRRLYAKTADTSMLDALGRPRSSCSTTTPPTTRSRGTGAAGWNTSVSVTGG